MLSPTLLPVSTGRLALEKKDDYSSNTGRKERQWVKIKRKLEKPKGEAREPRLNSSDFLRKVIGEVTSIE